MQSDLELEVATEREGSACWIFQIRRSRQVDPMCELTLAWSDYDWWSPTGSHTPSQVALAVMQVLAESPTEFAGHSSRPMRIDASTIRRRISGADRLITERLQRCV
ncbi:MAG: hypothetical protein O2875_04320 [Planctomycetota bacterium]|nr:hypothetical protein [Planctomycetota bacterium]MDA1261763.1 hypothetical protein [Planctomycetota bacterium]